VREVASGTLGPEVAVTDMEQRNVFDFTWHPDGTILNITSGDPVVRIWEAATGKELARHRLGPASSTEGATFAWFTDDGKHLLVGTTTGRLHVLDARTLVPAREPIQVNAPGGSEPSELTGFVPTRDGRTVYTTDRIIDYGAGTVRPFPDLGVELDAIVPSPDGTRLFVDAGTAGTGLLDLTTMTWIARPTPAQARMIAYQGAFTEDGSRFASVGDDGRVNLWDGRTGAYVASMPMDTNGTLAFTKDGTRILVADSSGSILTWDLDPTSWVSAACRLAGRELTEEEWRTYLPDRPFTRTCST
jgi:WD40 repeat protein